MALRGARVLCYGGLTADGPLSELSVMDCRVHNTAAAAPAAATAAAAAATAASERETVLLPVAVAEGERPIPSFMSAAIVYGLGTLLVHGGLSGDCRPLDALWAIDLTEADKK
jgi:hypothetical protein